MFSCVFSLISELKNLDLIFSISEIEISIPALEISKRALEKIKADLAKIKPDFRQFLQLTQKKIFRNKDKFLVILGLEKRKRKEPNKNKKKFCYNKELLYFCHRI